MSLQIDLARVTGVLLADGWHKCDGLSLDAYEFGVYYRDDDWSTGLGFDLHHGGGNSGVCATGFSFKDADTGVTICGPLTAVQAVAGKDIDRDPPPRSR